MADDGALRLVGSDWGAHLASAFSSRPQQVRIVCPFIKRAALQPLLDEHVPAELKVVTRSALLTSAEA